MGKNFCSGIRRNSTLKELDIADEDDMNNSGSKCRLEKIRLDYIANDATTLLLTKCTSPK